MEQLAELLILKLKPGSGPALACVYYIFTAAGKTTSDFLPRPVVAPDP
jgi:hypothetical protein